MNSQSAVSVNNSDILTYRLIAFLCAASLALLLSSFPDDAFYDRAGYISYAYDSILILANTFARGIVSVFTNEPIWLLTNISLAKILGGENVISTIVFFSTFVTSYLILVTKPKCFLILLVFLLMPQVLKNNIVHLRQGFAISFFLMGFFSKSNKMKLVFLTACCFIHSSFFIVSTVYVISLVTIRLRLAIDLRVAAALSFGLFFSFFGLFLAGAIGARQAESEYQLSGLGFGFLFWFIVLGLFLTSNQRFLKQESFSIFMLIFYLSTYLFSPFSARVFESTLLVVLLSGLNLSNAKRLMFYVLILFYFLSQWLPRLTEGYFGWSAN